MLSYARRVSRRFWPHAARRTTKKTGRGSWRKLRWARFPCFLPVELRRASGRQVSAPLASFRARAFTIRSHTALMLNLLPRGSLFRPMSAVPPLNELCDDVISVKPSAFTASVACRETMMETPWLCQSGQRRYRRPLPVLLPMVVFCLYKHPSPRPTALHRRASNPSRPS